MDEGLTVLNAMSPGLARQRLRCTQLKNNFNLISCERECIATANPLPPAVPDWSKWGGCVMF